MFNLSGSDSDVEKALLWLLRNQADLARKQRNKTAKEREIEAERDKQALRASLVPTDILFSFFDDGFDRFFPDLFGGLFCFFDGFD
jgi:hypothetical protein